MTIQWCGLEHVYKLFSNSPTSKLKEKSVLKELVLANHLFHHTYQKIEFIKEMLVFMHQYIERIVNVKGDGNCGYQVVSALLSKEENNQTFFPTIYQRVKGE